MGRKKLTTKKRTTSVTMDPEIEGYILRMEGKNFSLKFANLVRWCMTREEFLYKQEKDWMKKLDALRNEYDKLNREILKREQFVDDLDAISQAVKDNFRKYTS